MANVRLRQSKNVAVQTIIQISGSKSETNRLLLLQALYPGLILENSSNSDDSKVMHNALSIAQSPSPNTQTIDVHHAGTAMRFLTAFFATQEGREVVITGSSRMKERPIKILVDALLQLGADISYEESIGFPPLRINGKRLENRRVCLPANVSSQYISALLLIAPKLKNGLELILEGEIASLPYIHMTLSLLNKIGVATTFEKNTISIRPASTVLCAAPQVIESDWSSASYWYSLVALSEIGYQVTLSSFKRNSLQGDAVLVELYKHFGVETTFNDKETITLTKSESANQQSVFINLQSSPDLAQTIAVTCFGLGISCHLMGLHTLKIKETDRLEALQKELTKLGADIHVTSDDLRLNPGKTIKQDITITTYQDHRMAMAFAPLGRITSLVIEDAEVVTKSYPGFWNDLKKVGFDLEELS